MTGRLPDARLTPLEGQAHGQADPVAIGQAVEEFFTS